MTPQQALEEAKKRYPEGTKYKSVLHQNPATLKVENPDDFTVYAICEG
ncbi:hypothetical protein [Acinetobacter sp.]|nr:hypothetical protein [Acinetobacter sp.]